MHNCSIQDRNRFCFACVTQNVFSFFFFFFYNLAVTVTLLSLTARTVFRGESLAFSRGKEQENRGDDR